MKFAGNIAGNKVLLAIGAGVVATGAVAASAASLGTLDATTLGTSTSVVASCNTDPVDVEWGAPTYSTAGGVGAVPTYLTSNVTLAGLSDDCDGLSYSITFADDDGVAVGSGTVTGTVPTAVGDPTITAAGADTALIENATITIYG